MSLFKKLSELETLTVKNVTGYEWKAWDDANKKMHSWQQYPKDCPAGLKPGKRWTLDCQEGVVEVSSHQFGNMLEACNYQGVSDPRGKKFNVKNNGQTGKEIRYFINLAYQTQEDVKQAVEVNPQVDDTNIPF